MNKDKKIPAKALCVRKVSSWSKVKPEYKFDMRAFNANEVKNSTPLMSPKMDALMKKIKELDEEDLKTTGKLHKHIIYSDVIGTFGAKMIASVLIANNMTLAYDNKFKLKPETELRKTINKNFALLTSSVVYSKPLTVKLKKGILAAMNERPNNIFGENIRFLILDQTFKEGIDVFDVKYLHILEPLLTKAEKTQVVGRGTRFCGQSGLPFNPKFGWKLEVYTYNMGYDQNTDVFQLYLKHSNIDLSTINFSAELEDLLKVSSVDYILNENIHDYNNTTRNRFKKLITDIENIKQPHIKKDKIMVNIDGKIYTNETNINCNENCHGALAMAPLGILLLGALYADTKLWGAFLEKWPKQTLCNMLSKNSQYCKAVNRIWLQPINFLKIHIKDLLKDLSYLKSKNKINKRNLDEIVDFINKYYSMSGKERVDMNNPPPIKYNLLDLKKYIKKNYIKFKWPKIKITNLCEMQKKELEDKSKSDKSINVTFTLSQDFVRHYFTPESPYKGLLLYHSVGTGKTCTAIATATSSFERKGYTIIWVTRHTLKEDIWKNMFEKICNTVIQEKVKQGLQIPSKKIERTNLVGRKWFPVLSYKQFTNMIKGNNKFYNQLVRINGKEDPYKNTLIIIDEIHKVYSSSLSALEKPDPAVLLNMAQKSYNDSGVNSVRFLLMTATPMTEDPLSSIKILNLLLPKEEQFTENYEEFIKQYCNSNGVFTDRGAYSFMNKISGYISYLDRSSDVRQFAYPVYKSIFVNPSKSTKVENNSRIKFIENELNSLEANKPDAKLAGIPKDQRSEHKKKIADHKEKVKNYKAEIKLLKKNNKEDLSALAMIDQCIEAKAKKKIDAIMESSKEDKKSNKTDSSKTPESPKPNFKRRLPLKPKHVQLQNNPPFRPPGRFF